MKKLCTSIAALLTLLPAAQAQRVVTLGGDVTEIVYALGRQHDLVCTDQTSTFPAAATKLPQVGYLRNLSAEGVLSCKPDLVIASADAGPDAAMKQLAASGIRITKVPRNDTVDAVRQKIRIVSDAIGAAEGGKSLLNRFDATMAATNATLSRYKDRPRAIFLMAHGPGGAMAAGTGTAANAMLSLAHADNAATGFSGYKPLTPEAAITLKPGVIIIDEMSLKTLGGMAAFKARPEIAMTPAAKAGRIIAIDTMFVLGFGPRTPEAIAAFAALLHKKP
jgi:iron complex transport system substrate-binding protein